MSLFEGAGTSAVAAGQPVPLSPVARAAVAVLIVLGVLLLFAGAMVRIVSYDEDQYIAAGVMARELLPYRDFVYLQPPLYPFVLAGLFKLSGGWFLLTGRLFTFVLALVGSVLLWRLLRRLGASFGLAVVLMAACLTSPFLSTPLANTRNDALPLVLMLAGLSVHLWAIERSWWGRVLAALLFGLAVEAKVSYLFAPLALGLHALVSPRLRLPPFILGSAIAAVPAVLCFMAAPEAFRFGVLDYHLTAPVQWYGELGLGERLTLLARVQALLEWMLLGGNLTLMLLAAALSIVAMARRHKWKRPGLLLLGLLIGAVTLGIVPSPSWAMYYAAVPPLLACCIAHMDRITTNVASPARKRLLIIIGALPILPVLVLQTPDLAVLARPAAWVGVIAHRTAVTINGAIRQDGDVATLFPHAVLDANPVRREFAAGPFVFRSGDLYTHALLARLHALSPGMVEAAFDERPPAAIYTGLYPTTWKTPMDAALTRYAEQHRWRLVLTDPAGARLWVRP